MHTHLDSMVNAIFRGVDRPYYLKKAVLWSTSKKQVAAGMLVIRVALHWCLLRRIDILKNTVVDSSKRLTDSCLIQIQQYSNK